MLSSRPEVSARRICIYPVLALNCEEFLRHLAQPTTPLLKRLIGGPLSQLSHQARYYFAKVERLEYFGYVRSASLQPGVIRCGTFGLERKRNPASISLRGISKQPTARANARSELQFTFTIGPYDDYPANQVVVKKESRG